MPNVPLVEPFSKASVSRAAVEQERLARLKILGAISSEITDGGDNWILTTVLRVEDGNAIPPAGGQTVAPAPIPIVPPAPTPAPATPILTGTRAAPSGFGVDSLSPPSSGKLATVASKHGVATPSFWGRYFYGPGQMASGGNIDTDHYSPRENPFLRSRSIRVLPIARQTGHVGGDADRAIQDADQNVGAIFECFPPDYLAGADPNLLVFLDVEEAEGQPKLRPVYFASWSARLQERASQLSSGRVTLRPALYTSQGAGETFNALKQAMAGGAACFGVWTARQLSHGAPIDFSDAQMLPKVPLSCPTLLCQYFESADGAPPDENLDMNICNPPHQDVLLGGAVIPPG